MPNRQRLLCMTLVVLPISSFWICIKGVFEVKSTNGDTHIGDEDLDIALVNHILNELEESGFDLSQYLMAIQCIREAARKVKAELSSTMQIEINLSFITTDATSPKHINLKLSRCSIRDPYEPSDPLHTIDPFLSNVIGVKSSKVNKVILQENQSLQSPHTVMMLYGSHQQCQSNCWSWGSLSIKELMAMVLAYVLDHAGSLVITVYDLGGGTFDISILKMESLRSS
ncbi:Hsp70 protein-domain-containing protein [Pisolithus marmoratus]|nr:Hsp70 protein-domain-containing protein [Pisolithus marmoratus]